MKLYDLRTEYRENPIGLTDKAPRFSWKIESEEQNTIQTVYEINVTDEKGNVVWNSGKKASDQSVLISYEGEKLADEMLYKVGFPSLVLVFTTAIAVMLLNSGFGRRKK